MLRGHGTWGRGYYFLCAIITLLCMLNDQQTKNINNIPLRESKKKANAKQIKFNGTMDTALVIEQFWEGHQIRMLSNLK